MSYCETCGSALREGIRLAFYSVVDGSKVYLFTRTCPKWRWWRPRHSKVFIHRASVHAADLADEWEWRD